MALLSPSAGLSEALQGLLGPSEAPEALWALWAQLGQPRPRAWALWYTGLIGPKGPIRPI